ncbi:MAG TPA: alpha-L-fucosidase [Bryobacteraceae bacterium]|jgi:alpha-L-fucosidase|nr:alpha-L-fucosidase [Bryobacteraceae bacterium]
MHTRDLLKTRRDVLKTMSSLPVAAALARRNALAAERYEANWASLDARPIPDWYTKAKFGIFIHWGLYSVPAFAAVNVKDENPYAEWYWNSLTEGMRATAPVGKGALTWDFHKRTYGPDFSYFDFAPLFRAELFDPDYWAGLFVDSGAKYVALTSKHHEGFTLWRNPQANRSWGRAWNAVDIGPKRDLLLDLTEAGRRKGLHIGIYYSLYEWYNPLWLSDKRRYVAEHMIPQFKDVVTHAKPDIIFSDGEWELPSEEWRSTEILAWLFNESPVADRVVIDDRWGSDTRHKHGGYYTTEYTSGMQQASHAWEESRGMGYSYGYNRMEALSDYHSDRQLLLMLVDIVSRGGNLLLDIGPRADGRIPVIMEERLRQIGSWLQQNGEAIYETTAFKRPSQWSAGNKPKLEDKEFRAEYDITKLVDSPAAGDSHVEAFFTQKGDVVYAILPRWPKGDLVLREIPAAADCKVTLLGSQAGLRCQRQGDGVAITIPLELRATAAPSQAYVLKLAGIKT